MLKSTGMSDQRRGRFITFEGGEGSGKSTQIHLLGAKLKFAGLEAVVTREPGGTPAGEKIRSILLDRSDDPIAPTTEALLMSAARAEHVAKVIEPGLSRGAWVLSDRYTDSTYVYQGFARGLRMTDLRRIQDFATNGMEPDLTILLDIETEVGLARRQRLIDTTNRLDSEAEAFHERVRSGYHSLVARDPARWLVIDATQSVDAIADQIWSEVSRRFSAWLSPARRPSQV